MAVLKPLYPAQTGIKTGTQTGTVTGSSSRVLKPLLPVDRPIYAKNALIPKAAPVAEKKKEPSIIERATTAGKNIVSGVQNVISKVTNKKTLPSGTTIEIVFPKTPQPTAAKTTLKPDFGEQKISGQAAEMTPQAQERFSEEYIASKPKRDVSDKLIELWRNPAKLVPFANSAVEAGQLVPIFQSASKLKNGTAEKQDVERLKKWYDYQNQDTTFGYKVLDVVSQILPFAGELYATAGIATAGKAGAFKSLQFLFSKAGKELLEKDAQKFGIKLATGVAGRTLQAPVSGATRVAKDTLQNQIQAKMSEDVKKNNESVLKSFTKAELANWVEVVSEFSGNLLNVGLLPTKIKDGIVKSALFRLVQKLNPGRTSPQIQKVFDTVGYNGMLGEMFEERIADVGQGILEKAGLGDQPFKLPSKEQLLVEMVSFSIPGLGGQILSKIPSGEYAPRELLARIIDTGAENDEEGKEVIKTIVEAEKQGANINFQSPEVTQETVARVQAQPEVQKIDQSLVGKVFDYIDYLTSARTGKSELIEDKIKITAVKNGAVYYTSVKGMGGGSISFAGFQKGVLDKIVPIEIKEKEIKINTKGIIKEIPNVKVVWVDAGILPEAPYGTKKYAEKLVEQYRQDIQNGKPIDPIAVRMRKDSGIYSVIDGNTRIEALRQLGYKKIPIIRLSQSQEEKAIEYHSDKGKGAAKQREIFNAQLTKRGKPSPLPSPERAKAGKQLQKPQKPEKKSVGDRRKEIQDYIEKKYTKLRVTNTQQSLIPLPSLAEQVKLTTRFLEHPDIKGKMATSYSYLYNLSKSSSLPLKSEERQAIQNVLDTQFKDEKKINLNDFRNAILHEMLPLEVIETSSYADYGADNVSKGDLDHTTYLLNSPFEHGKTGHFGGDFNTQINKDYVKVVEIPAQAQNPYQKYAVVREGVTLTRDNIEENVFTVTTTKDAAEKWIEDHVVSGTNQVLVPTRKGLFAHFRTFDDTEAGDVKVSYVAEIQSDVFQHNVETLGKGGKVEMLKEDLDYAKQKVLDAQQSIANNIQLEKEYRAIKDMIESGAFVKEGLDKPFEKRHFLYEQTDQNKKTVEELSKKYGIREAFFTEQIEYFFTYNRDSDKYEFDREKAIEKTDNEITRKLQNRIEFEQSLKERENQQKVTEEELKAQVEKTGAIPRTETLFKGYKGIWQERVIREAIYLKANEGYKYIRFPSPHTVAVIEGYLGGADGEFMPYEIVSADDENRLTYGDTIEFEGEEYTVVDADNTNITVAPSDKVRHFSANQAMEEDIESRWEDLLYEYKVLQERFGEIKTSQDAQDIIDAIEVYNKLVKYNNRVKDAEKEASYFYKGSPYTSATETIEKRTAEVADYDKFIKALNDGVVQKEKMDYEKIHDIAFKDRLEEKYGIGHPFWNYLIDKFPIAISYPGISPNQYKVAVDETIRYVMEIRGRLITDIDAAKKTISDTEEDIKEKQKEIRSRKPPTKEELKLLPKKMLEDAKKSEYPYYLDNGLDNVLDQMAQDDTEEVNIDDYHDKFYENMADGYDGDYEGIYGRGHVFYEEEYADSEIWVVEDNVDPETLMQPDEYEPYTPPDQFDMNELSDEQKTVLTFYEKQVIRYLEKTRKDLKLIEDSDGFMWYETMVTEKDLAPPMAYRLKDDLARVGMEITDAQEKEIIALNTKIFGDTNVRITGQILSNRDALGAYRENIIQILNKQANPKDTFYHEAVHKYLDVFMNREEHIDLMMQAQDLYGYTDLAQVEERLAEDFITYARNREGVVGRIRVFFDKVFARIKAFFKNQDLVDAVYQDIITGKGKRSYEDSKVPKISSIDPAKSVEDYKKRVEQLNKVAQMNAIPRRTRIMKKAEGRFEHPSITKPLPKEGTVALHGEIINSDYKYMEVLAHELGHALEFAMTGTTNKNTLDVFGKNLPQETKDTILEELKAVTLDLEGAETVASNPGYYHRKTELLARFFQKMFASPGNLEELAPTANKYFEMQSIVHPQIMDFLQATQEMIDKGTVKFKFLPDLRQTYQRLLGDRVGNIAYDEEVVHRAMQERAKYVTEKFINEKFKGIKDSPELLFKAAESIKVTRGGVPEFGTRKFIVAKNEVEYESLKEAGWELVGSEMKDGEKRPLMAQARYTPEEGKKLFEELSPAGKGLVLDFTSQRDEAKDYFNREIIKDLAGIESKVEGWVHHFFEEYEGRGTVTKGLKFKTKVAGARKQRKEAEGFVQDFRKATLKALTELQSEKVYNDFISRQFARVTKPIPEGKDADPGWVEVVGSVKKGIGTRQEKKMTIIQDGKVIPIRQPRYQMPKEIYERYKLWKGLAEEASTAVRIVNDINRYWRINILSHLGSATTNLISGGVQFSTKTLTDFYTETLTGDISYKKTRADISSMLKVLLPKGWYDTPDWIYGSDLSNWYGEFTKAPGIVNRSIDSYANVMLKAFSAYERYWKKVVVMSENGSNLEKLNKMDKSGLRLPTKEERELIATINRQVDLYAYDYDNVPLWLEHWSRNPATQLVKPFAKYPYKYAKHITNMAGAVFDRSLPWQTRVAKLLSLATIVSLYAWFAKEREKRQQTPAGTAETPARISPRGRLFVTTDDKGNEIFIRTAKYPFINLTDVGRELLNKNFETGVDIISDMIGTIAPVTKLALLALGYKNKYEMYDEPGIVIGNSLSSYVPLSRALDDISRMLDPYQRKQTRAYQTFTKMIPTTSADLQNKLHGEIRTTRIPLEGSIKAQPGEKSSRTTTDVVLKNYWQDILLSFLTGIYVRRINPEEAEAVQIRAEENKAKAEKKK